MPRCSAGRNHDPAGEEQGFDFVLDAAQMDRATARILERYGIPKAENVPDAAAGK